MKTNGYRRGSVLMEFIIVFPIYLILFAGTVAIGDMLIHSNRLVSADRVVAFGVEGWSASGWNWVCSQVFHPGTEIADDASNQDVLSQVRNMNYADSSGPWTVCAAATAQNSYKPLAGGTLGQLLSAHLLLNGAGGALPTDLQTWSVGNGVPMRSKGTDVQQSFYVLKRRRGVASWRDMTSGLLKNDRWRDEVANEAWFDRSAVVVGVGKRGEAQGASIGEYGRYGWPSGWQ